MYHAIAPSCWLLNVAALAHSCPLGCPFESCVDLHKERMHDFWVFKANVIIWLSSYKKIGSQNIIFEIHESPAFLPCYGLLTGPVEWIYTMHGRVIYNLHACSTFTKVGGLSCSVMGRATTIWWAAGEVKCSEGMEKGLRYGKVVWRKDMRCHISTFLL